jgi:hypothetical protein
VSRPGTTIRAVSQKEEIAWVYCSGKSSSRYGRGWDPTEGPGRPPCWLWPCPREANAATPSTCGRVEPRSDGAQAVPRWAGRRTQSVSETAQSWGPRRCTFGCAGNVAGDVGRSVRELTRARKSPRSTCAGDLPLAGSFSSAVSSRAISTAGPVNPGRCPCGRFSVSLSLWMLGSGFAATRARTLVVTTLRALGAVSPIAN